MAVFTWERPDVCKGCPFKEAIPIELIEPGAHPQPEPLCHESNCLEGDLNLDYVCQGWRKQME